jgi:hypothetical protein
MGLWGGLSAGSGLMRIDIDRLTEKDSGGRGYVTPALLRQAADTHGTRPTAPNVIRLPKE